LYNHVRLNISSIRSVQVCIGHRTGEVAEREWTM
jgi:hypothetical protein